MEQLDFDALRHLFHVSFAVSLNSVEWLFQEVASSQLEGEMFVLCSGHLTTVYLADFDEDFLAIKFFGRLEVRNMKNYYLCLY